MQALQETVQTEENHRDLEARVVEEEYWHLNSDTSLAKVVVL